MANDFMTTTDMVADALDLADFEINELREAAPLMAALPAQISSNGTTHKYARYTQSPVVGFRSENAGRDFDHSVDETTTVTLKILDFSWACDKAVADAWMKGGASAFIAREGMRHLQAALFTLEQQWIYGTAANGFAGLVDQTNLDGLSDEMVFDSGGSAVGAQSSVYFLRVANDNCGVVMRGDGVELGDTVIQNFIDGNDKNYPAYYTPACTWVAGQYGGKYSAARLANVEASAGNSLTDDKIYEVLAAFPAGQAPNMIVMHKEVQEQLRASRTATNQTGAPAPMVDSVAGIRILTTDAIKLDEAVVA